MSDEAPRTIYVVTDGHYSDYHIEAVFSSRALAEAFVAGMAIGDQRADDRRTIEDYPLDPIDARERTVFTVDFDHEGNVYEVERGWWTGDHLPHRINVAAHDEDHARKIAGEQYAQWKARQ